MKKCLIILLLSCACHSSAFSTAQIPDIIIYQGKEYKLHSNPLEAYFEKYPEKREYTSMTSTALWRGYRAIFEVVQGELLVKDVEIQSYEDGKSSWTSIMDDVFPEQRPVKVDWQTGLLVIPYGKRVNYVHMGYASTYKKYILLEFDNGDLVKEKKFKAREYERFKERQFQEYRKSEEYRKLRDELKEKDPGLTDEFIDHFLKIYIIDYSSTILAD